MLYVLTVPTFWMIQISLHLLRAWKANMDIQYVLDPYTCAVYILSYITKGQRGMSKLLRKACEEAKEGNKNIK